MRKRINSYLSRVIIVICKNKHDTPPTSKDKNEGKHQSRNPTLEAQPTLETQPTPDTELLNNRLHDERDHEKRDHESHTTKINQSKTYLDRFIECKLH